MVAIPREEAELVRDLLDGYVLTLEDSKRTILDLPELAGIAGDGVAQIDEKIVLARRARGRFDA